MRLRAAGISVSLSSGHSGSASAPRSAAWNALSAFAPRMTRNCGRLLSASSLDSSSLPAGVLLASSTLSESAGLSTCLCASARACDSALPPSDDPKSMANTFGGAGSDGTAGFSSEAVFPEGSSSVRSTASSFTGASNADPSVVAARLSPVTRARSALDALLSVRWFCAARVRGRRSPSRRCACSASLCGSFTAPPLRRGCTSFAEYTREVPERSLFRFLRFSMNHRRGALCIYSCGLMTSTPPM